MHTITIDELVKILIEVRGAQPVTFIARTDAGVRAKDKSGKPNPHPRPIWKTAAVNGIVNFFYDRGVLRRLQAEGKTLDAFRSGSSWHLPVMAGNRLTPLCTAIATARNPADRDYYLRVMCLTLIGEPEYHDADGRPLAAAAVEPFLRKPSDYANQGLDRPLVFKTFRLAGLQSITLQGQHYRLGATGTVPVAPT